MKCRGAFSALILGLLTLGLSYAQAGEKVFSPPLLRGWRVDRCTDAGCSYEQANIAANAFCQTQGFPRAGGDIKWRDYEPKGDVYKWDGNTFVPRVGEHKFTTIICTEAKTQTIDKRLIPISVGDITVLMPIEAYKIEGDLTIDNSDPDVFRVTIPEFSHIGNEQVEVTYSWKVKIPTTDGFYWSAIANSGELNPSIYHKFYGYELTAEMVLTSLPSFEQAIITVSDENRYYIPMYSSPTTRVQHSGTIVEKLDTGLLGWDIHLQYELESFRTCHTECQNGHWATTWYGSSYCTGQEVRKCIEFAAFSDSEKDSIVQAVNILARWVVHPEVADCALERRPTNYKLTNNQYADGGCFTECQHGKWYDTVFGPYCDGQEVYQCRTMNLSDSDFESFVKRSVGQYFNGNDGNYLRFPKINLRKRGGSDPDTLAYADIGTVNPALSFSLPDTNGDPGEFTITFTTKGLSESVEEIAGTIGHEIMHQMGHVHPKDAKGKDIQTDYTYNFGYCIRDMHRAWKAGLNEFTGPVFNLNYQSTTP